MTNWQKVVQGLLGAFLNSAANGIVVTIVDPGTFNLFQGGAWKLTQVVVASGILGAALWLKQHPIDPDVKP